MKRKLKTMFGTAASMVALTTFAQVSTNSQFTGMDTNREAHSTGQRSCRLNEALKASHVIGMTVKNYQNEKLGKVEDLAVDVESGRVVEVILSSGGYLGLGDRLTAVPPSAFRCDATNKVLHLDADREKIKNSPEIILSRWSEYGDSNSLSEVYGNYGQSSSFTFIGGRDGTAGGTDAGMTANQSTNTLHSAWSTNTAGYSWQNMIPESRLSHLQRASKLIGKKVRNLQDQKVGEVENLIVDLPSGRILAVILASGGFLGMDEEFSAVPPTALKFNSDRRILQMDASRELMTSAPHFNRRQWPDMSQPEYAATVYQAYGVQPYFGAGTPMELGDNAPSMTTNLVDTDTSAASTNAAPNADNTARNVRDRNSQSVTPLDQGNSNADISTTAQIRKEIIADNSMSTNAKNVKIITLNGHVTLRGPVNSEDEKREIGAIANRIATDGNVDNQIEVQVSTSSSN